MVDHFLMLKGTIFHLNKKAYYETCTFPELNNALSLMKQNYLFNVDKLPSLK